MFFTPQQAAAPKDLDGASLVEWMSRLEAKLDAIGDSVRKGDGAPPAWLKGGPAAAGGVAAPPHGSGASSPPGSPHGHRRPPAVATKGSGASETSSILSDERVTAQHSTAQNSEATSGRPQVREIKARLEKKKTALTPREPHELGPVGKLVMSPYFDNFVTSVILVNALLIGAQVQHKARSTTESGWHKVTENICMALFTIELVCRITALQWDFLANPRERIWNCFDFFLVVISWIDFALDQTLDHKPAVDGSFVSQFARLVRILRITRLIRTVRFLTQLRTMTEMIARSLYSLFWVLVILAGIIYIFAVILTEGATQHLTPLEGEGGWDLEQLRHRFGSLFDTMYTLFQCVSGGLNWGEANSALQPAGDIFEVVFILYIFFAIFAVTNIVNGVFVDGAIELAKSDRMTIVEKKKHDDDVKVDHLVDLLAEIDGNSDNRISFSEFVESSKRPDIHEYFSALHIEIDNAKRFFELLDLDHSGSVNLTEFVTGMMKLKGEAKSVDVHLMMQENRKLMHRVNSLVHYLHEKMDNV